MVKNKKGIGNKGRDLHWVKQNINFTAQFKK